MSNSSMLHIRLDEALKNEATQALEAMGMTVSEAVRILLEPVADDQAFPLELRVPNARARAVMKEARRIAKHGRGRLTSADALFRDLEKGRRK